MKIGDYVRTKKGEIGKITYVSEYNTAITTDYTKNSNIAKCVGINNIIKSSPNIIDLIEVGDYVNGYKVEYVCDDGVYIEIPFVDDQSIGCNSNLIRPNEIKTIVTKEQFENIEYKVVE